MKKNDKTALHQLSIDELRAQATQLSKELALAEMSSGAMKLKNTSSVKMMRKRMAVIKTLMSEKQIIAEISE